MPNDPNTAMAYMRKAASLAPELIHIRMGPTYLVMSNPPVFNPNVVTGQLHAQISEDPYALDATLALLNHYSRIGDQRGVKMTALRLRMVGRSRLIASMFK